MSKKGNKKNQDKIAAKKAAVLGTEKKSGRGPIGRRQHLCGFSSQPV